MKSSILAVLVLWVIIALFTVIGFAFGPDAAFLLGSLLLLSFGIGCIFYDPN